MAFRLALDVTVWLALVVNRDKTEEVTFFFSLSY